MSDDDNPPAAGGITVEPAPWWFPLPLKMAPKAEPDHEVNPAVPVKL